METKVTDHEYRISAINFAIQTQARNMDIPDFMAAVKKIEKYLRTGK